LPLSTPSIPSGPASGNATARESKQAIQEEQETQKQGGGSGQGGCAVAADKQAPIAAVMAKKTQLLWGL